MTMTWIFNDGVQKHPCTSFPYAYRMMFNLIQRTLENGQSTDTLIKKVLIHSPLGRIYDYDAATQLAQDQGLLKVNGELNSSEFKRKNKTVTSNK